jgi:hypothetical protein
MQGWDTTNPQAAFDLPGRETKNFRGYIADATPPFIGGNFWLLGDLRVVVAPFAAFRYHLHRFLNLLLNDDPHDVFGNVCR